MFQRNQFQRPQYERLCNQAKYIVLIYSIFGTKREAYKLPKSLAEGEGVENTLSLGNSTTAGPDCIQIWCVLSDQLATTYFYTSQRRGASARAHVHRGVTFSIS